MFSTIPSTGTSSVRNISAAFRASATATRGGWVTTTAPGEHDRLREAERNVAGAGRKVHHEHIQLGPCDAARELLYRLGDDRAAPDRRRALAEKEAEADERKAVHLERQDVLVRATCGPAGAVLDAEEQRQAGAVDVGIEESDAQPLAREDEREIGGDGALPDAALSRSDRHNVAHRGEPDLLGPRVGNPGEPSGEARGPAARTPP